MKPKQLFFLLLFGCIITLPTPVRSAEPIRVGIVSIDNYQALAFTQLFHNPPEDNPDLAGLKVVAAWPGGSPDLEESYQNVPRWKPHLEEQGATMEAAHESLRECGVPVRISEVIEKARAAVAERTGRPESAADRSD